MPLGVSWEHTGNYISWDNDSHSDNHLNIIYLKIWYDLLCREDMFMSRLCMKHVPVFLFVYNFRCAMKPKTKQKDPAKPALGHLSKRNLSSKYYGDHLFSLTSDQGTHVTWVESNVQQ